HALVVTNNMYQPSQCPPVEDLLVPWHDARVVDADAVEQKRQELLAHAAVHEHAAGEPGDARALVLGREPRAALEQARGLVAAVAREHERDRRRIPRGVQLLRRLEKILLAIFLV